MIAFIYIFKKEKQSSKHCQFDFIYIKINIKTPICFGVQKEMHFLRTGCTVTTFASQIVIFHDTCDIRGNDPIGCVLSSMIMQCNNILI